MRNARRICAIGLIVLGLTGRTEAVVGQLVRKAISTVGKRSTQGVRHGLAGAKRVAPRGLTQGGGTILRHGARANVRMSRPLVISGTHALTKTGGTVSKRVIDHLGLDGARALRRLSPAASQKLAGMSGALAKSPYRTAWIDTIAKHGDSAANWLWKHKGAVAVGSVATAIVAKPDDFLRIAGSLAEATVEATAEHVVAPLVKTTSHRVVASIVAAMAATIGGAALWFAGGLTGLLTLWGVSKWTWRSLRSK